MYERYAMPHRKVYISIPEKPVGKSARIAYREAPNGISSASTTRLALAVTTTTDQPSTSRRSPALYAILLLAALVIGVAILGISGAIDVMLQKFGLLVAR
jgi:hypothetical protein